MNFKYYKIIIEYPFVYACLLFVRFIAFLHANEKHDDVSFVSNKHPNIRKTYIDSYTFFLEFFMFELGKFEWTLISLHFSVFFLHREYGHKKCLENDLRFCKSR